MKRIDAVIRREQFSQVKKALDKVHCPGMMVFTFRGHGRQGGITESYGGRKFKVDLLPKVLITIFAGDEQVEGITGAIVKSAKTGHPGDGKIFISTLDNAIRVRTGDEGSLAI